MPEEPETPTISPAPPPPARSRMRILPVTRLGWWAVGLAAVTLVLPLLSGLINLLLNAGSSAVARGIAVPGVLMAALAVAAGILGLIAVLRSKERALLVWLPIFLGFFFFFLVIIDIIAAV